MDMETRREFLERFPARVAAVTAFIMSGCQPLDLGPEDYRTASPDKKIRALLATPLPAELSKMEPRQLTEEMYAVCRGLYGSSKYKSFVSGPDDPTSNSHLLGLKDFNTAVEAANPSLDPAFSSAIALRAPLEDKRKIVINIPFKEIHEGLLRDVLSRQNFLAGLLMAIAEYHPHTGFLDFFDPKAKRVIPGKENEAEKYRVDKDYIIGTDGAALLVLRDSVRVEAYRRFDNALASMEIIDVLSGVGIVDPRRTAQKSEPVEFLEYVMKKTKVGLFGLLLARHNGTPLGVASSLAGVLPGKEADKFALYTHVVTMTENVAANPNSLNDLKKEFDAFFKDQKPIPIKKPG